MPAIPSNLIGSSISYSQINLSWKDNANNETGIEIKRATDAAFTQNVVWKAANGVNLQNFSDTGLAANTIYYYRVRALNSVGKSEYSNTISIRTRLRFIDAGPIKLTPIQFLRK